MIESCASSNKSFNFEAIQNIDCFTNSTQTLEFDSTNSNRNIKPKK